VAPAGRGLGGPVVLGPPVVVGPRNEVAGDLGAGAMGGAPSRWGVGVAHPSHPYTLA